MKQKRPNRITATFVAVVVASTLSACGGGNGLESPESFVPAANLPRKLAPLRSEANQLLPGGEDAFRDRLASVRGYPVVVTKWASWCGPCIGEMPVLSHAANRLSKKVAFVGVNSEDAEEHAAEMLADTPIPYPSYTDPDLAVANVFTSGATYMPAAGFYGRDGELLGVKYGPFTSVEDVIGEVERQFGIAPDSRMKD